MTHKIKVLRGDDKVILPYYKIEQTEEGKQFFYDNIGYFNFWDKYLIMNIGYKDCYTVLVNRPNRKFKHECEPTEDYKIVRNLHIKCSVRQRKPEEMFDDFPELKKFDYLIK